MKGRIREGALTAARRPCRPRQCLCTRFAARADLRSCARTARAAAATSASARLAVRSCATCLAAASRRTAACSLADARACLRSRSRAARAARKAARRASFSARSPASSARAALHCHARWMERADFFSRSSRRAASSLRRSSRSTATRASAALRRPCACSLRIASFDASKNLRSARMRHAFAMISPACRLHTTRLAARARGTRERRARTTTRTKRASFLAWRIISRRRLLGRGGMEAGRERRRAGAR